MDRFFRLIASIASAAVLSCMAACSGEEQAQGESGAFLSPVQQRDSVLIADRVQYGFRLNDVEEGTTFALPQLPETLCEKILILTPWQVDTIRMVKHGKDAPASLDISGSVTITSFDEGEYVLPPIVLQRTSLLGVIDTLTFSSQPLSVKAPSVDVETFEPHDIKGQIRYPVTMSEIIPYLIGLQLIAIVVILVVCLVMMSRKKDTAAAKNREPAHIVALRKLDNYRGDKLWAVEKQKAFYSGVTDVLREYIVSRYGISAMEMTTGEIFGALGSSDIPGGLYEELHDLFERSDYVKFAKYVADNDENASVLPLAVRFVTSTYQSEIEADAAALEEAPKEDMSYKQEAPKDAAPKEDAAAKEEVSEGEVSKESKED